MLLLCRLVRVNVRHLFVHVLENKINYPLSISNVVQALHISEIILTKPTFWSVRFCCIFYILEIIRGEKLSVPPRPQAFRISEVIEKKKDILVFCILLGNQYFRMFPPGIPEVIVINNFLMFGVLLGLKYFRKNYTKTYIPMFGVLWGLMYFRYNYDKTDLSAG